MPQFKVVPYKDALNASLWGFDGHPADWVISVLDPGTDAPDFKRQARIMSYDHQQHVRFDLYDTLSPQPGGPGNVDKPFLQRMGDISTRIGKNDKILVHCMGGISRSPALAIALIALQSPMDWKVTEREVTAFLVANPKCSPNPILVAEVDRALRLKGNLSSLVGRHRSCLLIGDAFDPRDAAR